MDGLQVWCLNHSGETLPFEWVPNTDGNVQLTGRVVIASIQFGGDVKTKNSNDFSFVALDVAASTYTEP